MSGKKNVKKPISFLDPIAMGGIIGGNGYAYQDRYIVCHIPLWLANTEFFKIMPEASGDVDVIYKSGRKHLYEHIQVKNHTISVSEFKQVLDTFQKFDKGLKKTYRKFTLSAPGIHKDIGGLKRILERVRELNKFIDSKNKQILKQTVLDTKARFTKLGLGKYFKFCLEKVHIEIGQFDLDNNDTCRQMFLSRLVEHPKYKKYILDMLSPAYSTLIEKILAHRGKMLDHETIHKFIGSVLSNPRRHKKTIVIHLHNWTKEKFDLKANYTLDWTSSFDRSRRIVPDAKIWNNQFVPQLQQLRNTILQKTSVRSIQFRGRVPLSTGTIFGMHFPEIGNWVIELEQPPQTLPWRSDADLLQNYKVQTHSFAPQKFGMRVGRDLVFVFNVTGNAMEAVKNYLASSQITAKRIITIQPESEPSNNSIKNDSEALSLAAASKEILKSALNQYKPDQTHLFLYGPVGLAMFLGQKLTSVGTIQLYEYQDPGYKPSCLIKT